MAGENTASGEATKNQNEDAGEGRDRSSIGFPYNNLNDAIEVAQAIHANVGSGDCDDVQLAAWLKMSHKSSGYRVQISAARMFGLIETANSLHKLSALGKMIVDPQREREARAKAFMKVPLYARVYEQYKGTVIPPSAAFERDIMGMGVAEKQKGRARQVFEKSAEQGGFFEQGRNRLVMPGIAARSDEIPEEGKTDDNNGKTPPPPPPPPPPRGPTLHPFIQGLLDTLPEPQTEWAASERAKWLQTAANIFDLIYKGNGGGIVVSPARADRSPRPLEHD
jgi:hypothetical protein